MTVYDRADPAAARVVIVAGSDFEGTSPKLFWPATLVYSLPGSELSQMLTLVVAIKSEMPCEPELLLFAGMNDHLHATGFLEQLKGDEPAPKKIWEAIQTLFAAMNEVQENVASRFGSKTKVAFTTSPGYASMPPALQFVYAILILIAEGNGWRILMAAPNRELEPTNLRLRRSELAAAWADVSHALRGFYELADILIVLDEVLLLDISNFARQLKLSPIIGDDHPVVTHLTASLWFRSMELTITSSTSKPRGPRNERKNVAAAEKQLESMVYRLTQERGRWPFLTPRLENTTDKTRVDAPPLVKQVWDVEEIKSLGLPEHQQKVTILVVSTMLALRWMEENIAKYRESKAPTAESIHAIDYSRRLELFETACKVFAIPMEVRHMWSRLRFFPWFRATLTSWLYVVTKDHMRKHQKEYRQFQAEIGPDAFKRPLLTHRN